jgi:AAA15 family ATPase/GTPase
MLIEFRVRNYRSLRDDTILSMVASADKTFKDTNVQETGIRSLPGILRTAGIYGANAAGKTNIIRAMALMRMLVLQSAALQPGQQLNVQPFMLDPSFRDKPTEFEVTFLLKNVRYQYGFVINKERVLGEWLNVYKTAQPQNWYTRTYNPELGQDEYKFGSHFQGQRQVWRASTRPNALFLSVAVQLNSDQLKPLFDWFTNGVSVFEGGGVPFFNNIHPLDLTLSAIQQAPGEDNPITQFLLPADTSIAKIGIEKKKGISRSFRLDTATGKLDQVEEEKESLVPHFLHSSPKGSATFEFPDESEGFQRLFVMAGPLFEILRGGCVLFIDELDRSLHALLVQRLIMMFQDSSENGPSAQLIYTTHNTSLLGAQLLRRDQIWLVEKDEDQASGLYPLSDFSPRRNEALEKAYLEGRYGGIPILKKSNLLGNAEK